MKDQGVRPADSPNVGQSHSLFDTTRPPPPARLNRQFELVEIAPLEPAAAKIDGDERLMEQAAGGRLTKLEMATSLAIGPRQAFLEACAEIEKKYTDACAAAKDPCLEAGCAAEGEVCLEPLLRAGLDYPTACGAEFVKLFRDRANRA
jgi:hypothetical protein